jgi:Nucleoside-diphosphate-sugar epimerases
LLRLRFDRWNFQARDERFPRAGQPRQSARDDIKQFAEEIIRITGTKSTIEYKPLPVDDPKVRQPDITRAKEVLSWEPRVQFEEGIKKTIDYFEASLNR